jgi:C2 domain of PTEN tumour-suppressor protein
MSASLEIFSTWNDMWTRNDGAKLDQYIVTYVTRRIIVLGVPPPLSSSDSESSSNSERAIVEKLTLKHEGARNVRVYDLRPRCEGALDRKLWLERVVRIGCSAAHVIPLCIIYEYLSHALNWLGGAGSSHVAVFTASSRCGRTGSFIAALLCAMEFRRWRSVNDDDEDKDGAVAVLRWLAAMQRDGSVEVPLVVANWASQFRYARYFNRSVLGQAVPRPRLFALKQVALHPLPASLGIDIDAGVTLAVELLALDASVSSSSTAPEQRNGEDDCVSFAGSRVLHTKENWLVLDCEGARIYSDTQLRVFRTHRDGSRQPLFECTFHTGMISASAGVAFGRDELDFEVASVRRALSPHFVVTLIFDAAKFLDDETMAPLVMPNMNKRAYEGIVLHAQQSLLG